MTLSEIAWKNSLDTYSAIVVHPFNQKLMNGTLETYRYNFYLEQDEIFVEKETKLEAIIASEITDKYQLNFLSYAQSAYDYSKYLAQLNYTRTNELAPTTLAYSNHLLANAVDQKVEVQVATILPCYWYYLKLGKYFAQNKVDNNPYQGWIDSYSSAEYEEFVYEVIDIFDDLSQKATPEIRQKMLSVFDISAKYEFNFYDDIYEMRFF
jgi:thiaminase/transcriptional activator TenA